MRRDSDDALRRISALGFRAVEPFGLGQPSSATERTERAERLRRQLNGYGLIAPSLHARIPPADEHHAFLDELSILGARYVIAPVPGAVEGAGKKPLDSVDGIKALAERLNEFAEAAEPRGIAVGYHNHSFEWEPLSGGSPAFDALWRYLDPRVIAEVDIYWAAVAGQDPARVARDLGERAQLLHVKDGPARGREPQTAIGTGTIDIDSVLAAATHARWHVIELDDCETDIFEAAGTGAEWLVRKGWSRWEAAE